MRKRINISEFEDQKLQVNTLIHHKKRGGTQYAKELQSDGVYPLHYIVTPCLLFSRVICFLMGTGVCAVSGGDGLTSGLMTINFPCSQTHVRVLDFVRVCRNKEI